MIKTKKPKIKKIIIGSFNSYNKIKELTPYTISLGFKNPNWPGTYFTTTSISSLAYREKYPTKAYINLIKQEYYTQIEFCSDSGHRTYLTLHTKTFKQEINNFVEECLKEKLLLDYQKFLGLK